MPRPRDLGVPFLGETGKWNAISDVPGVAVGFCTLIEGDAVRTGVTAILPRFAGVEPCFAATDVLNGNGEMTGTLWIEESGLLDSPVLITNTHSVGIVRDAVIQWQTERDRVPSTNHFGSSFFSLPVVAETADATLNDMNGFHVRAEHAFEALDAALSGPVAEGNVGGGTGMRCHGWKGGTGTASRQVGPYCLGVLVQANHGSAARLTIAGVPVGQMLHPPSSDRPLFPEGAGSIIVVVATDAPLMPHQLKRIARRVSLGIGRVGGLGENSSGDIFLAFSTTDTGQRSAFIPNAEINPFFAATVDATEEAVVNALFAAETMTGRGGVTVPCLPTDEVLDLLRRFGRLQS